MAGGRTPCASTSWPPAARSTLRARSSERRARSGGSPTAPTQGGRTSRRWRGRREGFELFGFVSFTEGSGGPANFEGRADFTSEVAESNPDWKLDLNDDVIGTWRGEEGKTADMTLVWGVPLMAGGAIVTAELANLAVDQCELVDERFTMIAPDNYRGDFLEVKLWSRSGAELAGESLYVDEAD